MSGQHKYPTISFRISDYERREIEAKIKASGMMKKDYFARSCIYNRVCVVGKKETVYPLVEELRKMRKAMVQLGQEFGIDGEVSLSEEELKEMQTKLYPLSRTNLNIFNRECLFFFVFYYSI